MTSPKRDRAGRFATHFFAPGPPTASPLDTIISGTYAEAVADEMELDPVYDAFIKSRRLQARANVVEAHPDLFPGKGVWFDNDEDPENHVSLYTNESLPGVIRYLHIDRADMTRYRVSELQTDLTFKVLARS